MPRAFLAFWVPRVGANAIRRPLVKGPRREFRRADLCKDVPAMNRDADHLRDVLPYVWLSSRVGPEEPGEATAHDHDAKDLPPSAKDEAVPFPPEPPGRSGACPVGGSAADTLVPVAIRESFDRGRFDPASAFRSEFTRLDAGAEAWEAGFRIPARGKDRESVVIWEAREAPRPRFPVPADEEVPGPGLTRGGARNSWPLPARLRGSVKYRTRLPIVFSEPGQRHSRAGRSHGASPGYRLIFGGARAAGSRRDRLPGRFCRVRF
jgi:hypothetical protein